VLRCRAERPNIEQQGTPPRCRESDSDLGSAIFAMASAFRGVGMGLSTEALGTRDVFNQAGRQLGLR